MANFAQPREEVRSCNGFSSSPSRPRVLRVALVAGGSELRFGLRAGRASRGQRDRREHSGDGRQRRDERARRRPGQLGAHHGRRTAARRERPCGRRDQPGPMRRPRARVPLQLRSERDVPAGLPSGRSDVQRLPLRGDHHVLPDGERRGRDVHHREHVRGRRVHPEPLRDTVERPANVRATTGARALVPGACPGLPRPRLPRDPVRTRSVIPRGRGESDSVVTLARARATTASDELHSLGAPRA